MGLTSHLSDAYDAFSSSCASFSLLSSLMTMILTNQMTKVQGPGSLLVRAFLYKCEKTNPTLEWILIHFKPDNLQPIRCRQQFCR